MEKMYARGRVKSFKELTNPGEFEAVFATLDVIDHDGDIIAKGAIEPGPVVISAYGHASWDGALPVGKGQIAERGNEAIVIGQYFMDTVGGQETYKTVKALGDLQEYSFALPYIERMNEENPAVITKVKVNEVSPVLMGAGINTRTLDIKTRKEENKETDVKETSDKENTVEKPESKTFAQHLDEAVETVESVTSRAKEISNLRKDSGKDEMSKAAARRLQILKGALEDAAEAIDELLKDPNAEATEFMKRYQEEHNGH